MQLTFIEQQKHSEQILKHFIGDVRGDNPGPTVIAVAGMHGNEPTGIQAIEQVIDLLEPLKEHIHGRFVGLKGNLTALKSNVRFVEEDMNRLWKTSILDKIRRTPFDELQTVDRKEVKELLCILDPIVLEEEKVVYIDLHTFSGYGGMFSITPREERHIELLTQLKIPLIFGIENTLQGTSMEYVEVEGHIGFAFETGSHGTVEAERNAHAGLLVLLVSMGIVPAKELKDFGEYYSYLMEKVEGYPHKVDFQYKHIIEEGDDFEMNPGFSNFDPVQKGDWLATDKHGKIEALMDGFILMPLYQKQGNDGFFIVRECE
ncbi:MAG: succinylglutamate desuccinylase/aspartoacylase family protein [Balneolaceae bacterium]